MKKLLCILFATVLQVVAQRPILEVDVVATDANDGFLGLSEVATADLATNTVARVKGGTTPGDGGGGDYLWNGTSWRAYDDAAAAAAVLPSFVDYELAKVSTVSPLAIGGEPTALAKTYDLDASIPLWGWWQVRVGASNSTSVINFPGDTGGSIVRFFDSTANDRRLQPAGSFVSLWAATNVISTGELSASFATSRPYYVTSAGAMGADGCAFFGVSDSDDADTSTTPQILVALTDSAGVLLSLEQYGTTLRVRHRDSGDTEQTNATSYTVTADLAFSWCLNFDKANGVAEVIVNNTSVGRFTGVTFTADTYSHLVWSGNWDGTSVSEGWDGQHAELGAVAKPLNGQEVAEVMNYLKAVSALDYSLSASGLLLHTATAADVLAGDAEKDAYSVNLTLPAGRIAVGVKIHKLNNIGATLTVSHNGEGGSAPTQNELDNLDGDWVEDGLIFNSSGGAGDLTITISAGTIEGVVVRAADDISLTVEDQGTGTHCFPLAIRHSNGKTYRIHSEIYTSRRFLSDGAGNSVQVFESLNNNDRYHNGAALVELDDGSILCAAVGHGNTTLRFCRVSADLATISTVRSFADGNACTYIHLVKRPSDGSIYGLTRVSNGSPTGALLVHIPDPEDFENTSYTSTKFVETDLRLYPRRLILHEQDGKEYLLAVWATRVSADWEGFGAVYQDLATGIWRTLEGTAAPNESAPFFDSDNFTGSIEDNPGTAQVVLTKNDGTYDQWYALNDVLVDLEGGEIEICTLYSTSDVDSFSYGTASVWRLSYEEGGTVNKRQLAGLSPSSYRVDLCFLPYSGKVGLAFLSLRGNRSAPTDAFGETVPLYYDWYGEDFQAYAYAFDSGNLIMTDQRDITTTGKTGYTHGWLSRIPGQDEVDVQVGLNEGHYTHRQTERKTLSVER